MANKSNNIILPDDLPESQREENELEDYDKKKVDKEDLPDHLKRCKKCKKIKKKKNFTSERFAHLCRTCILLYESPDDSLDYGHVAFKERHKKRFFKDILDKAQRREKTNKHRVGEIASLPEDQN